MKRSTSLSLRVVGTMVAAAIAVLGMPTPPASAAPLDHVAITANTPSQVEGNSGTTPVTFAITYTGNPTAFSIDWATSDGTASAGSDYAAASGTVLFSGLPSDRTKTATVMIDGDTNVESNETFTVTISNPIPSTNIVIDTPSATQTIGDDDSAASFSIADVTAAEGDAGNSTFSFAITKTGSTAFTTSVDFATADGSATVADADYATTSGTLSFLPGDTSKTVDVTVHGDTEREADETFTVNLGGAVGASITDDQGLGTISNDDPVPGISVDDQVVAEGNTPATTTMTFNVTLSNASDQTVTVDYATNDGTATIADSDYVTATGTLTFTAGQTARTVDVTVNGDDGVEPDEGLTLDLSIASNATLADAQGEGTITNDDVNPDASIADASVSEGDSGTTTLSFDVTLSHTSTDTVTVDWAAADGTATTGDGDYEAASGTVTFDPGDTAKTVDVTVNGDVTFEADEDLTVTLSNPGNAGLGDDQATGSITNDDAVPAISIDGQATDEGTTGDSPVLTFNVTLSNPSDQTVTVDFTTTDGTASTLDGDYEAASGTVTFDPGDTAKTVNVTVDGDDTHESDEAFTVDLSGESGATLAVGQGTGTITNDDAVPAISIDDPATDEGNTGDTPVLTFNITLSNPSDQTVAVDFTTTDGTATTLDGDYEVASGTVTFDPGDTAKTVNVTVDGDDTPELDEAFTVDLSGESGATLAVGQGTGTITNDDAVPAISVGDVSVLEGNAGDTTLSFDVTLSQISAIDATVTYGLVDDTATVADGDYEAGSDTLTFDPGQDTKQVDVTVHGDVTYENDETFTLALSDPTGATIDVDTAAGTITNDDAPPALAIGDVSKDEGNSGTTAFTFTVTKTGSTALPASASWATGGGDATPGSDYLGNTGTVNFPAGTATKTVTVLVNGDTVLETDQAFDVTLSTPTNATISDDTGTGTIKNDDVERTSLTLKRRLTESTLIAKGLLERATTGDKVRVTLFKRVKGSWVRLSVKIVAVKRIKDRDGDGKPDGRYRASFNRPESARYKLRARFAGSATQLPAKRRLLFRL
jgi:Calx-beta domain